MQNTVLSSHHHAWGSGRGLVVHRSDFGLPCGLGGYEWPTYAHDVPGLVWVLEGVMTVHQGDRRWLLTPQHAAWLPAGALGDVMANVRSRALYVESLGVLPSFASAESAVRLRVGPEAAAALEELATTSGEAEALRLWRRVSGLLQPVGDAGLRLPLPTDARARELAFGLMDQVVDHRGGDHLTLREWGEELHTSAKTLQRAFARETGMSYARWRTHARLNGSLPRLAAGVPVQDVARDVGYRSSVGYIDAFKAHFQVTPGAFFAS